MADNLSIIVQDNVSVDLTLNSNISINLDVPEPILIEVTQSNVTDLIIETGLQGAEGIQGIKGDTGDKGDNLTYSLLTPEEKNEVIAQFDSAIGNTSFANIFLEAYLS